MNLDRYRIVDGSRLLLEDYDTRDKNGLKKKEARQELMPANIERLKDLQEKLYAHNRYGVLVVIQAMDAGGKDGIVKHVMSGLNPAGTHVSSFKTPTEEENDHDYLWRIHKRMPRRGEIGIFNRSYYEEVIISRVHDLVSASQIPDELVDENIWERRYRQIRDYERYLHENGIEVIKIFLHLSKDEQRERLLSRIENPHKHWKFSRSDIDERQHWNEYQSALERMIRETSTESTPWYIVPADRKWLARYIASEILRERIEALNVDYPELNEEELDVLQRCHEILLDEEEGQDQPDQG